MTGKIKVPGECLFKELPDFAVENDTQLNLQIIISDLELSVINTFKKKSLFFFFTFFFRPVNLVQNSS